MRNKAGRRHTIGSVWNAYNVDGGRKLSLKATSADVLQKHHMQTPWTQRPVSMKNSNESSMAAAKEASSSRYQGARPRAWEAKYEVHIE